MFCHCIHLSPDHPWNFGSHKSMPGTRQTLPSQVVKKLLWQKMCSKRCSYRRSYRQLLSEAKVGVGLGCHKQLPEDASKSSQDHLVGSLYWFHLHLCMCTSILFASINQPCRCLCPFESHSESARLFSSISRVTTPVSFSSFTKFPISQFSPPTWTSWSPTVHPACYQPAFSLTEAASLSTQ